MPASKGYNLGLILLPIYIFFINFHVQLTRNYKIDVLFYMLFSVLLGCVLYLFLYRLLNHVQGFSQKLVYMCVILHQETTLNVVSGYGDFPAS